MKILLTFSSQSVVKEIQHKIFKNFKDLIKSFKGNIFSISDIYITFDERIMSVTAMDESDNGKIILDNFLHFILENEEVYIVRVKDSLKTVLWEEYFAEFSRDLDITDLYLPEEQAIPMKH